MKLNIADYRRQFKFPSESNISIFMNDTNAMEIIEIFAFHFTMYTVQFFLIDKFNSLKLTAIRL